MFLKIFISQGQAVFRHFWKEVLYDAPSAAKCFYLDALGRSHSDFPTTDLVQIITSKG